MTDREVVTRFLMLTAEAKAMAAQAELIGRILPAGVAGQAISGMPHGTNDADAANVQQYEGYMQKLYRQASELGKICVRFEEIISSIKDDRQRVICRYYYGANKTDEWIGKQLSYDTSSVNILRNKALMQLS